MRRVTGLKLLIGVFLFAVPAVLVIEGRRAAREILAAGLIVGFFLVLAGLRKRPRREAMRAEASRLGRATRPETRLVCSTSPSRSSEDESLVL